ncbi:MobQ family relaxase, partial [Shewanella surugensis]
RTGITHDYSRKMDVIESLTLLPENAPKEFKDSATLWNAVEAIEKRKDAQLFREIEVSLPREQTHQQNKELVLAYCDSHFVSEGMCATVAFHSSKSENPHAHIMLTTREVSEEGFGKKNRQWNERGLVEQWRKCWAEHVNEHLEKNHIDERVDHRSLVEQGISREATVHLGPVAHEMEKRGMHSERGDINRDIEMRNSHQNLESSKGLSAVDEMDQAREGFKVHKEAEQELISIQKAKKSKEYIHSMNISLAKSIEEKALRELKIEQERREEKEVQQAKEKVSKEQAPQEQEREIFKGMQR